MSHPRRVHMPKCLTWGTLKAACTAILQQSDLGMPLPWHRDCIKSWSLYSFAAVKNHVTHAVISPVHTLNAPITQWPYVMSIEPWYLQDIKTYFLINKHQQAPSKFYTSRRNQRTCGRPNCIARGYARRSVWLRQSTPNNSRRSSIRTLPLLQTNHCGKTLVPSGFGLNVSKTILSTVYVCIYYILVT